MFRLVLIDVQPKQFFYWIQIKHVVRLIDLFSVTKIIALVIVIVAGVTWIVQGRTENLNGLMESSSDSPGNYALAFYSVNIFILNVIVITFHILQVYGTILFYLWQFNERVHIADIQKWILDFPIEPRSYTYYFCPSLSITQPVSWLWKFEESCLWGNVSFGSCVI